MKKLIVAVIALLCAFVVVGATAKTTARISLDEAKAKISEAVADPSVMESTMAALSAADQVKFVAAVNAAIGKLSGSVEQRTAAYLAASEAALKAASDAGNLQPVLAEIFATVPPNSLAFLSERFADTLFNRALGGKTYTDAAVSASSKKVLTVIHGRTESVQYTDVRDALAAAMFVRASNGTPKDLAAELVTLVSTEATRPHQTELVMAALAGDYETLLDGSEDNVQLPDPLQVLRLRDPQLEDALSGDLLDSLVKRGYMTTPLTEQIFELDEMDPTRVDDPSNAARPLSDGDAPFNPDAYQGQSI